MQATSLQSRKRIANFSLGAYNAVGVNPVCLGHSGKSACAEA